MNLLKAIEQFSETLIKETTRKSYLTGLYRFNEFLAGRLDHSPLTSDLNELCLRDFYLWLTKRDYKPLSKNLYLASVTSFLLYAQDENILPREFSVQAAEGKARKVKPHASYPVKEIPDHMDEIIRHMDTLASALPPNDTPKHKRERLIILRNRALAWFFVATACRLNDAVKLDRKDVQDGKLERVKVVGKGDKASYLYIPYPEARAALKAYLRERNDAYEPLFLAHGRGSAPGTRIGRNAVQKAVEEMGEMVGFHASPHMFRHWAARQMHELGAPLDVIQERLRHTSIGTTRGVYVPGTSEKVALENARKFAPQIGG